MEEKASALYSKDYATNASTGLMAIRDLSSVYKTPIDIHFENDKIMISVGQNENNQVQLCVFYAQDLYRIFSKTDAIYYKIIEMINSYNNQNTAS